LDAHDLTRLKAQKSQDNPHILSDDNLLINLISYAKIQLYAQCGSDVLAHEKSKN